MGGRTSSRVKNANTKKNYDQLRILVPRGNRALLMREAAETGFDSLNAYVNYCIMQDIAKRKGPQRAEEHKKAEFLKALLPDIGAERILCVCEQTALQEQITNQFEEMEVTHCRLEELDEYANVTFDVVILTKSIINMSNPLRVLESIKELLRDEGILLWVFDIGDEMQNSFSVVSGHGRQMPTSALERSSKLIDETESLYEFTIINDAEHGFEPWASIVAWKMPPDDYSVYERVINKWQNEMVYYDVTYEAAKEKRFRKLLGLEEAEGLEAAGDIEE